MKFPHILALAALCIISTSYKPAEDGLLYYTCPTPYPTVSVTPPPADAEVRNIIFMIGDGMGLEQISCAWVLNRGKLNIDNFPVVGLSRTYCTDNLITDSAAGGTALAAGQKTAFDHIGCDPDGNPLYGVILRDVDKPVSIVAYNVPKVSPKIEKKDVGKYPTGVYAMADFSIYEVPADFGRK